MRRGLMVSVFAVAGMATTASAQFLENFDSYAAGTVLDNIGGWAGWDNSPAAAGIVSNQFARSGPNSIQLGGNHPGDDAVHPFTGYTSGQWTLTAYQYIPSALNSDTYFIVNNDYNHGGPYQWAVEIQADTTTGYYLDDFRPEANLIPVVFDQWVEFRMEIDLNANTMDTYVGGVLLSTGTYTRGAGHPLVIANIDLFTTGGQQVHYDDISIVPAPGAMGLLALSAGLFLRRRRA